jgi:hypothetical protein
MMKIALLLTVLAISPSTEGPSGAKAKAAEESDSKARFWDRDADGKRPWDPPKPWGPPKEAPLTKQ